jgi:hypothetical protein
LVRAQGDAYYILRKEVNYMKFSPAEISAFVIAFFSFCLMMMNIVDKINNVRGAKTADDAGFINKETLTYTYGANRAENAKNEAEAAKQAKKGAKKSSPQAHL